MRALFAGAVLDPGGPVVPQVAGWDYRRKQFNINQGGPRGSFTFIGVFTRLPDATAGTGTERLTDIGRSIGGMVAKDQNAPADGLDRSHDTLHPASFILDPACESRRVLRDADVSPHDKA